MRGGPSKEQSEPSGDPDWRSGQAWPEGAWPAGTRVRVVQDPQWSGPWRQEFTGTIDSWDVPNIVEVIDSPQGELEYQVCFDEAQDDMSDDGPYSSARILARYLRRLEDEP
ncbi:hypothetical protein CLV92_1022 [Kineococcus xinjiangensis]|uniref:Uncharacterized protein n=1 Tax=Kineococcus xinjiangensis TaxID=512762 RepID=A0A2S6IUA5_9ACTN|nr:ferrous iron transport protein A [Kineococcus xinjiangensis]PPK97852.1 hypothetical protein CLV92_1022 [Kineococcus xinjiangensis]